MNSVKIALIGTSCVGKTTILDELKNIFTDYVFINEVAREYFIKSKSNDRFSFQDQKNIQDLVIETEKKMNGRIVICDRSVICPIIYTHAGGDVDGAQTLHSRVSEWIPTYTHLVILDPSEVPYEKDLVRDEDNNFRMKVHKVYLEFLKEKNIEYSLISGSLEDRIKKVTEIINKYE